jgi:DNA-binding CsgD family transcriptional regulator
MRPLTKRQGEICGLVARGLKTGDIATCLGISKRTVQNHLQIVFWKLRIDGRRQIINGTLSDSIVKRWWENQH